MKTTRSLSGILRIMKSFSHEVTVSGVIETEYILHGQYISDCRDTSYTMTGILGNIPVVTSWLPGLNN